MAAARISLDDFYRDLSFLPESERARTNFDDPAAIDWEAVAQAMAAMRTSPTVQLPQYDYTTHTRKSEARRFEPRLVVIWDGLWLLHRETLRAEFALSIFVECPAEERLRRRIARDCRERGRTGESVVAQFTQHVAPMHDRFVVPQRQWADICVDSPISEAAFETIRRRVEQLTKNQ
jgi:uridine kinase